MKTRLFISLLLVFGVTMSCQKKIDITNEDTARKNKEVATRYHELKPENIDSILTENFFGQNEKSRHTWNRESHRKYLTNGMYKVDTIFNQIAEGDWVATRFFRTAEYREDTVKFEMMHFKKFENGKIAEIWEYGDSKQIESENK